MPEFILEAAGRVDMHRIHATAPERLRWIGVALAFDDLDAFTRGYIEALFFTSQAPGIDRAEFATPAYQARQLEGATDGCLPGDCGFSDLHPLALESIIADCKRFQSENAGDLGLAYGAEFPARVIGDGTLPNSHRGAWEYDETAAGRDFWYNRNGHGVGYWDRGLGDVGERLSTAARAWREVNPFYGCEHVRPDSCVHLS